MTTPQEKGRLFEAEIADEFGLRQTPASGALWHSPLDIAGKGTRWSNKFTEKGSYAVSQRFIDEAVRACEGPGSDGSIPIWILRIQEEKYDLIIMRKNDWKMLLSGDIVLNRKEDKSAKRRKRSSVPILMREEQDD